MLPRGCVPRPRYVIQYFLTFPVIDNQVAYYTGRCNYRHSKRCSNENSAVAVFFNNIVCDARKYIVGVLNRRKKSNLIAYSIHYYKMFEQFEYLEQQNMSLHRIEMINPACLHRYTISNPYLRVKCKFFRITKRNQLVCLPYGLLKSYRHFLNKRFFEQF